MKATRTGIPSDVQETVDRIGEEMNAGRYEEIYNEAAEEWRRSTTLDQSNATFKTLKDKLGNVKNRSFHSATEGHNTSADLPGHTFIVTYETTFEHGTGMETFTLLERNGRWQMAKYFVNSSGLK